jgi:hypothetical protein
MHRLAVAVVLLFGFGRSIAQSPPSDPQAISLAQKSALALSGGLPIGDVTVNAQVNSFLTGHDTGTATLQAKGLSESRVDLNLSSGTRSDVRNALTGVPSGAWSNDGATSKPYAQQNCWTDAAWFFPALSSLTQTSSPTVVFKYIGQERHLGIPAQHIAVFSTFKHDPHGLLQKLTIMDFYLDSTSSLPLAVAFQVHPDNEMATNISSEVRFAEYQNVNGVQVPFHVQSLLNGSLMIDLSITKVSFNTGLQDSAFSLP